MNYLDTPKHRAPWTIARRMSDRLFPQAIPGRHRRMTAAEVVKAFTEAANIWSAR